MTGEGPRSAISTGAAGSAVGLMEASFFRSFAAVNGARFARRLRRSETIDSRKTSEGHASMRSTAWRVTGRAGRLQARKFGADCGSQIDMTATGRIPQFRNLFAAPPPQIAAPARELLLPKPASEQDQAEISLPATP
jgi:hypothetical protein